MTTAADSAARNSGPSRLSDARLKELLRLMRGAHSVELKLTVPVGAHRATIQGLPMDPVEAQPRQIYFFDTPDLALYRAGVVVRARRIAGGKGDTVIKLRPVEPDDIAQDLKNDKAFNIEVDALPGGFVCSASFKGRSTGQAIRDAVSGNSQLSKLFSKAQRSFYRQHAPAGLELDSLQALGPTFVLKGRFDVHTSLDGKAPPRSMVAEVWLYPDGSRILELSTKTVPNEAVGLASEVRTYLVEKGVPTNAAQETKTLTALQYYSKTLLADLAAEEAAAKKASARKPAPKATSAKAVPARRASTAKATPAKTSAAKATAKPGTAKTSAAKTTAKPGTAKPATAKATAAKATAVKATAKPATAKAATAKPSAAKTSTAKPSAANATAAKATAAKATAKTSTAKPSTAKPSAAKATAAKTTAAKTTDKPATAKPTTAKPASARRTTATRSSTRTSARRAPARRTVSD